MVLDVLRKEVACVRKEMTAQGPVEAGVHRILHVEEAADQHLAQGNPQHGDPESRRQQRKAAGGEVPPEGAGVPGAEILRRHDANAVGQAHGQRQKQEGHREAGAHRGQRRLAGEIADDEAVRQGVDLLQQIAADQRQGKGQNELPLPACCHVFCHLDPPVLSFAGCFRPRCRADPAPPSGKRPAPSASTPPSAGSGDRPAGGSARPPPAP